MYMFIDWPPFPMSEKEKELEQKNINFGKVIV